MTTDGLALFGAEMMTCHLRNYISSPKFSRLPTSFLLMSPHYPVNDQLGKAALEVFEDEILLSSGEADCHNRAPLKKHFE
jgi:hypothetical protein